MLGQAEKRIAGAAIFAVVMGCSLAKTQLARVEPSEVTFFISTELRGYLGPCGCSENMRGGISRAAYQIERTRQGGAVVHFIDAGDGLFGTATIPLEAQPQQERKAQALAQAWKAMGLDVRATGPLDDARGSAFRAQLQLPELPLGQFKIIDGIGVVNGLSVADAQDTAIKARRAGALWVVALVPLAFDVLIGQAESAPEVDLLISTQARDAFSAEESRLWGTSTKVAQVQSKGRSLLRIDLRFPKTERPQWLKGDSEKEKELQALDERIELLRTALDAPMLAPEMKALRRAKLEEVVNRRQALADAPLPVPQGQATVSARFVPLEANFPQEPKVLAIEKAYDVDVGLLNLAWAKAHGTSCEPATPTAAGVVGSAACLQCHPQAEAAWRNTKHPQSYSSLRETGKQYHLDCIGCHVTGWRQPDGVCRIDETQGREEVGCEACHGPGSAHVKAPTKTNVSRAAEPKTCIGCHDHENSPHFDFAAYVEKIIGPGHGQPIRP